MAPRPKRLDWYREHGFRVGGFPRLQWYLWPEFVDRNLRFELPYQERLLRIGQELGARLHEQGITWWDRQLEEYEALPRWRDLPRLWEEALEEGFGVDIDDYPFWLLTARSMQYAWGANADIQMIREVADNIAGHAGVIMNPAAAGKLGLADGDPVEISSPLASTRGQIVLRHGIRPDTLLMIGQFGHWATPFASAQDPPSMNALTPMLLSLTDATGSGADIVRVALRPAGAPP